jgi:hypothetical protein
MKKKGRRGKTLKEGNHRRSPFPETLQKIKRTFTKKKKGERGRS